MTMGHHLMKWAHYIRAAKWVEIAPASGTTAKERHNRKSGKA
jgi:hypothetical protein